MKKKASASVIRIGSRDYWRDASNYRESWQLRARDAAAFIFPGSRVLVLGCGPDQALEKFLPPGCTYIPADIKQWKPSVRHIDLDAEALPPGTQCDCAVLLGVIEYLYRPAHAFQLLRQAVPRAVASYCHPVKGAGLSRWKALGWRNAFSESEFEALVQRAGWRIIGSKVYGNAKEVRQVIYSLSAEESRPGASSK